MTDWFGVADTVDSIAAGLDLEMPGPGRGPTGPTLAAAVTRARSTRPTSTPRCGRLLAAFDRIGALDAPGRRRRFAAANPGRRGAHAPRRRRRDGAAPQRRHAAARRRVAPPRRGDRTERGRPPASWAAARRRSLPTPCRVRSTRCAPHSATSVTMTTSAAATSTARPARSAPRAADRRRLRGRDLRQATDGGGDPVEQSRVDVAARAPVRRLRARRRRRLGVDAHPRHGRRTRDRRLHPGAGAGGRRARVLARRRRRARRRHDTAAAGGHRVLRDGEPGPGGDGPPRGRRPHRRRRDVLPPRTTFAYGVRVGFRLPEVPDLLERAVGAAAAADVAVVVVGTTRRVGDRGARSRRPSRSPAARTS